MRARARCRELREAGDFSRTDVSIYLNKSGTCHGDKFYLLLLFSEINNFGACCLKNAEIKSTTEYIFAILSA